MATNYPTSLDNSTSLPYPSSTSARNAPSLAGGQDNQNDSLIALQTKLGIGASTPTSGKFLTGTGTGTSSWANTVPAGTVVGTSDSQTLTNKTLTSPTISSPTITNATISTDLITGYTTSNTGTVYGIPITTGVINTAGTINGASLVASSVTSSALASQAVTTAALASQAVTAAKMVNGMVQSRQGGTTGAGSWATGGTSNTTTSSTNCFIQAGSISISGTAGTDTTITFPTAFTQAPIIVAMQTTIATANVAVNASSITSTNFKLRVLSNSGAGDTYSWIAIGQ